MVVGKGSDATFVLGESFDALACSDVPETNHFVVGGCNDLRLITLTDDVFNCVGVTCKDMDLVLGTHVPDSSCGISASSDEEVELRVECECIDTTEVSVVLPDDFVLLQVPALHLLVFATREQVWVSIRNGKPSDSIDMTS